MIQLLLVIGTLVLLAFLLSRREIFTAVTTSLGKDEFCPNGFKPTSLGIAPEWRNISDLNSKVRFFIEPVTGCIFVNNNGEAQRVANIIVLNDRSQIARFIQLNGLPTDNVPSPDIFRTPTLEIPALEKLDVNGIPTGVFTCPQGFTLATNNKGERICR